MVYKLLFYKFLKNYAKDSRSGFLSRVNPGIYKELKNLSDHTKDELVAISSNCLSVTELGENFAPQIANVFDKYDPPTTSYSERLKKINTVLAHPS